MTEEDMQGDCVCVWMIENLMLIRNISKPNIWFSDCEESSSWVLKTPAIRIELDRERNQAE